MSPSWADFALRGYQSSLITDEVRQNQGQRERRQTS
jgi:hypothetical protein